MTIHPDDALLISAVRHTELVTAAAGFRLARSARLGRALPCPPVRRQP